MLCQMRFQRRSAGWPRTSKTSDPGPVRRLGASEGLGGWKPLDHLGGGAGIEAGLGQEQAGGERGVSAAPSDDRSQVDVHRREEDGRCRAVVASHQHALETDRGSQESILVLDVEASAEIRGPPEDVGQSVGCDPLDDRQDRGGRVRRVDQADSAGDGDRLESRPGFPHLVDRRDRPVERLGGRGLVAVKQAVGHEGPAAGAFAGSVERCGDPPSTRWVGPAPGGGRAAWRRREW